MTIHPSPVRPAPESGTGGLRSENALTHSNSRLALVALSVLVMAGAGSAQANGSNFTVLSNGMDVTYIGLGAGGQATRFDGLGTWIPGEDLKGARFSQLGDWGYRMTGWRESVCVPNTPGPVWFLAILFPNIAFLELDGRNAHRPDVFSAPACTSAGLPGLTSGVAPYGVPVTPGVTTPSASFLIASYPPAISSALNLASLSMVLPNSGLVPSGHGGTATFVANTGLAGLLISSTGFCWDIDFEWMPSAIGFSDHIDGMWHYAHTSPDLRQYWAISNDEANAWLSHSVAFVNGELQAFTGNLDYDFMLKAGDPQTQAAIQPSGVNGTGVYYSTTVDAGGGNPGASGAGFDLGRHTAWSQSGTLGVSHPGTGLGNQDPAGSPLAGLVPTLGFATWDNALDEGETVPTGGWRLTWVTLDWDASLGVAPELAGEVTVWAGSVRVPTTIPSLGGWPQPITTALMPFLVHATINHDGSGLWPDPSDFPSGTFGIPGVNGTSLHVPLAFGSTCLGVPIALTYGSTGMAGPSGPLDWNPATSRVSSARQLFLLD